jgi:hypothetical protein
VVQLNSSWALSAIPGSSTETEQLILQEGLVDVDLLRGLGREPQGSSGDHGNKYPSARHRPSLIRKSNELEEQARLPVTLHGSVPITVDIMPLPMRGWLDWLASLLPRMH